MSAAAPGAGGGGRDGCDCQNGKGGDGREKMLNNSKVLGITEKVRPPRNLSAQPYDR